MQKPKIAFIDDEPRILRSLKMHFRQSHDVFTTTDATELMKYVSEHDVQVVISDQRMPDKQGTEVLRDIKEASPNTIRILLTGYADLNAVIDSVNDGEIYRYITKPWQNDELKKIVNKATEIAQQTQDITQNMKQGDESQSFMNASSKRNILVLDDDESIYQEIKNQFKSTYSELGKQPRAGCEVPTKKEVWCHHHGCDAQRRKYYSYCLRPKKYPARSDGADVD